MEATLECKTENEVISEVNVDSETPKDSPPKSETDTHRPRREIPPVVAKLNKLRAAIGSIIHQHFASKLDESHADSFSQQVEDLTEQLTKVLGDTNYERPAFRRFPARSYRNNSSNYKRYNPPTKKAISESGENKENGEVLPAKPKKNNRNRNKNRKREEQPQSGEEQTTPHLTGVDSNENGADLVQKKKKNHPKKKVPGDHIKKEVVEAVEAVEATGPSAETVA
uniref:Elf4 domain-containing protein n=1 Tax=Rhabditophanes sp. KR3021 TaxID=114890 RepID=A0AC35UHR5_9BILA